MGTVRLNAAVSDYVAEGLKQVVESGEFGSESELVDEALHHWLVARRQRAISQADLQASLKGALAETGIDADIVFDRLETKYTALAEARVRDLRVVFASDARRDLELIGDWIAEDNPRRALSYVRELRALARSLKDWPNRYPAIGEDQRLRRAPYGAYNIHYVVLDDRIFIWRIVHSAVTFRVAWPEST